MENYPAGVSSKDFDFDPGAEWEAAREIVGSSAIITYELRVFVDDTEVFDSAYHSDTAMQEDLHKVDHAINRELDDLADEYIENHGTIDEA